MNRILSVSIFCITLTLLGCKTKPPSVDFTCNLAEAELVLSEKCQPKMDCSFLVRKGSSIKAEYYDGVLSSASVESGDQLVFDMNRKYQDNPNIADDEFSEKLFFSIPAGSTSFHLEGAELKEAKMVFAALAYSRDGGYYPVLEGCLEGKLAENDQWVVQGMITITTRTKRKIVKAIRANYIIN